MTEIDVNQVLAQMRALTQAARGGIGAAEIPGNGGEHFSRLLTESLGKVNEAQSRAAELKTAFIKGQEGVDLPTVMVAAQEAELSFQAMTQVRNRLLSAYQEIMNMPV